MGDPSGVVAYRGHAIFLWPKITAAFRRLAPDAMGEASWASASKKRKLANVRQAPATHFKNPEHAMGDIYAVVRA